MKDEAKTKVQLISELEKMRQRITELEQLETERKHAEAELMDIEAFYSMIADNMTDSLWLMDLNFKITWASPSVERNRGYSLEELKALPLEKLLVPASLKIALKTISEQLTPERLAQKDLDISGTMDLEFYRKDSSTYWNEVNMKLLRDREGTPVGIIGVGRDIERKRMDEALRESEEKYRLVVENAVEAIFIAQDGMLKFVNRATSELLGYSEEEFTSIPFTEFIHQEDRQLVLDRHLRRLKDEEIPPVYPFRVVAKDGSVKWVEIHAVIVPWQGRIATLNFLSDITERKQVEDELFNSRQMLQLVLDNIPQRIFWKDRNSVYLGCNKPLAQDCGYNDTRDLIGKTDYETASVATADLYRADDRQVMETGVPKLNYEEPQIKPDGSPAWLMTSKVPLVDKEGQVIAVLGMYEDITERKRAEESLRESEEKFRSVVESSLIGIFFVNDVFKFTYANDELCRILGYSREEIIGHDFREFLDDESRKLVANRYVSRQRGEDIPNRYEFNIVRKDGEKRRTEIIPAVIKYSTGNIMTVGQLSDITDRKQAEEALQKSEEKYRAIIENMEEGYIEADLAGRITFFNKAAQKLIGYSMEEMMGMHYKRYTDKENSQKIFKFYNEVYRTHIPRSWFEWEVIRRDGAKRSVEGSAYLISDAEGRPVGFRGLYRDITDRKHLQKEHGQLQERLQRSEKMEALGTLAGGVAHDLNNVLGIVVGYSELLLSKIDETSAVRSYAMNVMQSGHKAAAIVQDLLTLARRGVHVEKVVNLNTIIGDYQKSPEYEKLCSFHPDVQIKTNLETGLLNITGSSVHLGKTFFNLVSNAAEAMPNGGVLTITTINQYLERPIQGYDDVREGDYVVFSVSDTGEGIQAADMKRIFEPFYTKKVMGRSGTGLGLAVVWGTVKDHNGYINVQSKEGKGTTFTLYFPVTREEVSKDQISIPVSEYMGNGESILVVDDVKGQRELAAQMLKKLNYIVATVSSGEEAIEYLKINKADLIVLDMIMDPGIDGLDTYRKILEINPKQKAIIVSGFSETVRVNQAQALGAGAYVRKPYMLEKIGLAVRKELDKK